MERTRSESWQARLKSDQEGKQDLSTLPTLELRDIPMKFEDV